MIYRGSALPATRSADASVFRERMPGECIEVNALLKQVFTAQP
jgi:hypothetical protein